VHRKTPEANADRWIPSALPEVDVSRDMSQSTDRREDRICLTTVTVHFRTSGSFHHVFAHQRQRKVSEKLERTHKKAHTHLSMYESKRYAFLPDHVLRMKRGPAPERATLAHQCSPMRRTNARGSPGDLPGVAHLLAALVPCCSLCHNSGLSEFPCSAERAMAPIPLPAGHAENI
jgi:hypothetical protein